MTALALTGLGSAADARLGDRFRARFAARVKAEDADAPNVGEGLRLRYGKDAAQSITFWPARSASNAPAPLIIFVHG
ncbi:hypothetical protein ABTM68_20165, partial [Acinetobacter baumannii]